MNSDQRRFIPYNLRWDDAPVDLSHLYEGEQPAGKHGFLKIAGEGFAFEDGTPARFWGTNFNSGANFPAHAHSEKAAERLARFGVNIVRLHQMDAEWSTPNIFQFAKGELQRDTMSLDPASLDRLDYLIHCLKARGIYIYMDLLTYRKFKSGDGLENTALLKDGAKPYSVFDRRMIELQKLFCDYIWNHVNAYTGLAYKDDPAIALVEVANEIDLFHQAVNPVVVEPYASELAALYREWAAANGIRAEGKPDFASQDGAMLAFLRDVQKAYYAEMIEHMRRIGVKIPIAGTNWPANAAHLSSQLAGDFTDSHTYWCGWVWKESDKRFDNRPMTGGLWNFTAALPFMRVAGKPFFVSEWDNPWPNEWRAEGALMMAAVGALQGWGGFAIHTYRYDTDEGAPVLGREITSGAIGGVGYRGGVFDTFDDPAKFGLFYHAALLFRRGDVREAGESVSVRLDSPGLSLQDMPCLGGLPEKCKAYMHLPGETEAVGKVISPGEAVVDESGRDVTSDTGEMGRDWGTKTGWIDTAGTKAIYGFVGNCPEIALNGVKFRAKTDFATIALSSLTGDPICDSPNMLLTAVGRAENTGSAYNEDHTVLLERGRSPVMIEAIEAEIDIATSQQNLKAWAVSDKGFFIGALPSRYKDGVFTITIGGEFASMYYLIQAQ